MSLEHQGTNGETQAEAIQAAVRDQLDRMLSSPHFNHSRRFPTFLRFVVEHALSGDTEKLKERTLGIEVFGRNANYDTASDPIVRVTAAEIRKRIAQYYEDPEHQNEFRLSLPSGAYVPQFSWRKDLPSEVVTETVPELSVTQGKNSKLVLFGAVLAAVLLFPLGLWTGHIWREPSHPVLDSFWGPVLQAQDPVLLCIADQNRYTAIALRDARDPDRQMILKDNLTALVFDDLSPVVKIAGVLEANGKQYSLRSESTTSMAELRNGTTVIVGAFDNAWALRLTKQLRFHFDNDPQMTTFQIVDSGSTPHKPWTINRSQQLSTNDYTDYALIARFTDSITGKLTIVVAGISRGGTIAAGEFLTDPQNLNLIEKASRQAGNKPNMEFVLSTQSINDDPGIPRIEASYFW